MQHPRHLHDPAIRLVSPSRLGPGPSRPTRVGRLVCRVEDLVPRNSLQDSQKGGVDVRSKPQKWHSRRNP